MPQHKSPNPRKFILPIRFSEPELAEIMKRVGEAPLGTWIRERALANLEVSYSLAPSPAQSEPLPPLEGGAPAPLAGESYTDYQGRLDRWAMEALTDKAQRARLEIATRIGVNYARTGYHQPSKM